MVEDERNAPEFSSELRLRKISSDTEPLQNFIVLKFYNNWGIHKNIKSIREKKLFTVQKKNKK